MIAPHLQDYIEQYKEIRKSSDKIVAGRQLQFSLAGFTDEQLHALTIEIVTNLPPEKNTRNSYRC